MKFIVELTVSSGIVRKINYEVVDEGQTFYVVKNSHKGYKVINKQGVYTSYEKIEPNKPGIYYVLQEVTPISGREIRRINHLQELLKVAQDNREKLVNLRKEVDMRIECLDTHINNLKNSLTGIKGGHIDGRVCQSDSQETT